MKAFELVNKETIKKLLVEACANNKYSMLPIRIELIEKEVARVEKCL